MTFPNGWLLVYESAFLHSLCSTLPAGAQAINIGAGAGTSACAMLRSGIYVASIDTDPEMLKQEKKAVDEQMLDSRKLFQINRKSEEAARDFVNESADLVFMDGAHSLEGVTSDLNLYTPKLRPGGILVCHDYGDKRQKAVTQAIKAWHKEHLDWLEVGRVLYMIAYRKPGGDEGWRNGRI